MLVEAGRERSTRWRIGIGAALVLVVGAVAGGVVQRLGADVLTPPVAIAVTAAPAPAASEGTGATGEVLVDVVGAVARPGVVRLPEGSRALDAIARAGGASDDAALEAVNLARTLVDGEQLHVPTREELASGAVTAPAAGQGTAPQGATGAVGGLVSLNRADAAALETLPRIGPTLAAAIIAHRDEHGPFSSVAELDDVPGIGPALMAALEPLVTL